MIRSSGLPKSCQPSVTNGILGCVPQSGIEDLSFSQRMRFASLLARAEHHGQGARATGSGRGVAESFDHRDRVLEERIEVFRRMGTLDRAGWMIFGGKSLRDAVNDYRTLALMADAANRTEDALKAIEGALRVSPNDVGALAVAAKLYAKASRYTKALEQYERLIDLDRRFAATYLRRDSRVAQGNWSSQRGGCRCRRTDRVASEQSRCHPILRLNCVFKRA